MMDRDRDRDRDRKPGGKRGKPQYYDRRRKPDEDWSKNSSSYSSKPKKKYGGRYDNRDYEYQYIHKDRKQYTREDLLKLASKAYVKKDTLDQLTIKYDLVFSDELRKPVGDVDDSNEDRFVETTNDNERDGRRDDYDGDRGYQRKKEFVRFDDFDEDSQDYEKVDSYLEKKYKQHVEEDDNLPAWATEDYEGETPAWGNVDSKEILKQNQNGMDWGSDNLKTLNKKEIKESINEKRNNYSSSEEEREKKHEEEEHEYYAYDKNKHKYHFFDEYEEEEELGRIEKQDDANRKKSAASNDSGTIPADKVEDLNSLFLTMKREEEEERMNYAPEIISANFYEEELRERKMELEANQRRQQQNIPNAGRSPPTGPEGKVSLVDDLFGGINSHVQHKYGPQPTMGASGSQFAVNNLSILGAFTGGNSFGGPVQPNQQQNIGTPSSQQKSTPKQATQIATSPTSAKPKGEEDIDLIVGPPPSVAKQEEVIDEAKEKRKKEFQQKYLSMDIALCQVVYDNLNSRKRKEAIDMHSTNGLNQIAAEKYCANNYKIFSFLMQGDIFSKVWTYKDKVGNIQGPYMSFDMDIWNGEGKYFSRSLAISPNKKDYFPLSMYVDRDERVLELMQEVTENLEKSLEQQPPMMAIPPYPPNWLPPQIIPGQLPLMHFPPGRGGASPIQPQPQYPNNRRRNVPQMEQPGMRRGGMPGPQMPTYQPVNPQMQQRRPDPSVMSLLNMGPPQPGFNNQQPDHSPEMTNSLKEMLGLPNDPAISNVSPQPAQQEKTSPTLPVSAQSSNYPAQPTKAAPKGQSKSNEDDFPSLSTLRK
jgi:hypothetical protein